MCIGIRTYNPICWARRPTLKCAIGSKRKRCNKKNSSGGFHENVKSGFLELAAAAHG